MTSRQSLVEADQIDSGNTRVQRCSKSG